MTASMRNWTPLFLKAEPPTTGTNWLVTVRRRMPALSCAEVGVFSSRNMLPISSSLSATASISSLQGLLGHVLQLGGNVDELVGRADLVVVGITDGLLVDDVDLAVELVFRAPGHDDGPGIGAELVAHLVDGVVEIRADAVHLVDEGDAGDAVLVGLAPDGLGLGLDAGDAAEHGDGAVEHAQRALHLGREVHVAGSVDDVDAELLALVQLDDALFLARGPETGRGRGGDGDAALALLLHPVGHRGAFMHLADLVDRAGVEKDALGQRGLARVDVRGDADVARALHRVGTLGGIGIHGLGSRFGGCGGHGVEGVSATELRNGNGRRRGWPAPSCARRRAS